MKTSIDKRKAIVAMIISAFAFSCMGVFIKYIGDIPTPQKALIRSIVIMSASFIMFKSHHHKLKEIKHIKLLTLRSVLGTIGILFNYYAIDHLILSDANVIFRLSTVFLLITCYIFLDEKLQGYQLIGIAIAFIGVIFIIKPSFDFDTFPFLIALGGSILSALAYTTLRHLGPREKPITVVLFFSSFTALVLLPYIAFTYEPMTFIQIGFGIAAGLSAFVGQLGVTIAYKHAPAKEVSIYGYLGVIFSAIFSIVLFNAAPDIFSLVGYILVFTSAYYMYKKQLIKA